MRVRDLVLALVAIFADKRARELRSSRRVRFSAKSRTVWRYAAGRLRDAHRAELLQPLTAVTSETGTYQFPRLVHRHTILLGGRDVILEAARHHRPRRMNDPERLVALG